MRPRTLRLAPVDEANLVLDHGNQVNVFLIAGLLGPGGFVGHDGQPDLNSLRESLRPRIETLPQLCRVPAPAGRRHRWLQADPDLDTHIRLAAPVDGLNGLSQFCGRLMTEPLPLTRPLWELLVVPGVSAQAPGMVLRIHHAVADGMSAAAIVQRLLSPEERAPSAPGRAESPAIPTESMPTRADLAKHPLERVRRAGAALERIAMTVGGRGVGRTALLGERGPQRGVLFVDADIGRLTPHLRPLGATVNDALLAAAAAGYAATLASLGESVPERLPVSIPVALRRQGRSGNQVGVMLVRLPLTVDDPDERLRLIAARTRTGKEQARRQGTLELMRGPLGARIMDLVAHRQRVVAGFVTNVPGPSTRLDLAGAPIVAVWPVAVLAANVRLGVAATSYGGRLWCSVHFDDDAVPGAVFARAMSDELERLAETA